MAEFDPNWYRRIAVANQFEELLEQFEEKQPLRYKHVDAGRSEAQYFRHNDFAEQPFESAKGQPNFWCLSEHGERALKAVRDPDAPTLTQSQADALWQHEDSLRALDGEFKAREITGGSYTGKTTAHLKDENLIYVSGWSGDGVRTYKKTSLCQQALDYVEDIRSEVDGA